MEATEPNTRKESHANWQHLLTDRDYSFVYFDALNRFYLSREHGHLSHHFALPPNVFDDIRTNESVQWRKEAEREAQLITQQEIELRRRQALLDDLILEGNRRDALSVQNAFRASALRREVAALVAELKRPPALISGAPDDGGDDSLLIAVRQLRVALFSKKALARRLVAFNVNWMRAVKQPRK